MSSMTSRSNITFSDPITERAFRLIRRVGPEVGEYLYRRSMERLSGIGHTDARHSEGEIRSVIITEADLKVHDAVVKEFQDDSVTIIAEEGTVEKENATYRIVLDDLDGTYNAARGVLGRSAISLAIDQQKTPLAAIWYNPYFDEMVFAEAGRNAWYLRGATTARVERVDFPKELSQSRIIIATGIKRDNPRSKLWNPPLETIMQQCPAPLSLESTVVGLMDVALGRAEGFVVAANKSWDLWGSRTIFPELSVPHAFFSECWEKRFSENEIERLDLKSQQFGFISAANKELFLQMLKILKS